MAIGIRLGCTSSTTVVGAKPETCHERNHFSDPHRLWQPPAPVCPADRQWSADARRSPARRPRPWLPPRPPWRPSRRGASPARETKSPAESAGCIDRSEILVAGRQGGLTGRFRNPSPPLRGTTVIHGESGRLDSNQRPLRPERSALARLSYAPKCAADAVEGLVPHAGVFGRIHAPATPDNADTSRGGTSDVFPRHTPAGTLTPPSRSSRDSAACPHPCRAAWPRGSSAIAAGWCRRWGPGSS